MRICSTCGELRELKFYKPDVRYTGGYRPQCRRCSNAVDRARHERDPAPGRERSSRYQKQQRLKLAAIKTRYGCVDCGYKAHAAALDFDHLPGTEKLFNVSKSRRPWEQVLAEIAKCEVVCANCHRIRTATRGGWFACRKPAKGYVIINDRRAVA